MPKLFVSNVNPYTHFLPSFWFTNYTPDTTLRRLRRKVLDTVTNELYLNDPRSIIRLKCFLLSITVPLIYTAIAIVNIISSILNSIYYLVMGIKNGDLSTLNKVPMEIGKALLAPFIPVFAELTVVLGLLMPLNARKIFASIERLLICNFEFCNYLHYLKYNNYNNSFQEEHKFSIEKFNDVISKYYNVKYENGITTTVEKDGVTVDSDDIEMKKKFDENTRLINHVENYQEIKQNLSLLAPCFQPKYEIDSQVDHQGTKLIT